MKIQIDQMAVFSFYQANQESLDETFFKHLYQAARDYQNACDKIDNLSSLIRQGLKEIGERGRTHYSIGDNGAELDKQVTVRDGAERLFRVLCEFKGIEVESEVE